MLRAGGLLLVLLGAAAPALAVTLEAAAFLAGTSVVPVLEAWGGSLCHHDPARTLSVGARLLAVCARCTGVYAGAAAGGLLALAVPLAPVPVRRAALAGLGATGVGLAAAVLEAAGLLATANLPRFFLGVLLGVGVPVIAVLGGRLIVAGAGRGGFQVTPRAPATTSPQKDSTRSPPS